jgi:hypothetical protein
VAILRINQIDQAHADAAAGWADGFGAIETSLPAGLYAYELRLIGDGANGVETDARARVQQLIIVGAAALAGAGHRLVARLDGPLIEVAAAIAWGSVKAMGMSAVRRFDVSAPASFVSLRASGPADALPGLFDAVGPALGRRVRLRLFAVPERLVAPLLDIDDLDDERWPEIFAAAGLVMDMIANLGGVTLLTRHAPDDLTAMLTERLGR